MTFFLKGIANELGIAMVGSEAVLIAVGFVILAAYTLSEMGSSLTLPRVTGYILTGLLLGPYALKILSSEVVQEIKVFNTIAIGLIAITAGLELHFASLKKVAKAIASTTLLKLLFLGIFVIGSLFLLENSFGLLAIEQPAHLLAVGLILAALCLGTSPAIALAVLSETRAKGRLSQLVLGSAIVKDVVVVVTLALALAFARLLVGGDGDAMASFIHLMVELFYSLVAGGILGALFIFYIRFVHQEMFLFILAMILLTAEISQAVHLELLLVFIVAGIVVRNFSKSEKVLHHSLEKVSLPVFVVFFTNVGAGLNLDATWSYLPVAATLFSARALAFFLSSWFSGGWHSERSALRRNVWLGYLPQAGVTLGLLSIATAQFTHYAQILENVGMGLVTLNLLIGPITLRLALKNGGEISEAPTETAPSLTDETPSLPAAANVASGSFEEMIKNRSAEIRDAKLREPFTALSFQLQQTFKKHHLSQQKGILLAFTNELNTIYDLNETQLVDKIDSHFARMGEKGRDFYNALTQFQKEIESTPVAMTTESPSDFYKIQSGDSYWVILQKLLSRPKYWFQGPQSRVVPFRKTSKYHLEPFVSRFTLDAIHSWYRLLGRHIDTFQRNLELESFDIQELVDTIESENQQWMDSLQADFVAGFSNLAKAWIDNLNQVNSIYLPESHLRYSQVEPEIKESIEASRKNSLEWEEKFVYCRNRLKVVVQSALLSSSIEKLLDEKFFIPVEDARNNARDLVESVQNFFENLQKKIQEGELFQAEQLNKLHSEVLDFKQNHLQADTKTKYVRGSFLLLNRDISLNLRKSLTTEEGIFLITSEHTPPHHVQKPSEILVKKVNLQELFEQSILINFLPTIEDKIEGISNYLESLLLEMEQAFSILSYSLDPQSRENSQLTAKDILSSIQSTIKIESEKIKELHQGLDEYILAARASAEALIVESQLEVRQGFERTSAVATARNQFRQRLFTVSQWLGDRGDQAKAWFLSIYRKIKRSARQLQEREIDRVLQQKMQNKTLDTATIRQYIHETYNFDAEIANLPRVYLRLFSLDSIQDRRFFVANQHVWKFFNPLTSSSNFRESQKILILGSRGMGKTSLLNVAQMDIRTDRLIRMEDFSQRSPLLVLAQHLGCQKGAASILSVLRRQSTTIIIDNLELLLSRARIDDFMEFLDIIKQSPHQCHWIMSMTKCNFQQYDKAFKLRSLFSKIVDLDLMNLNTAHDVILSRHRLSGLEIGYPRSVWGDWSASVRLSDPQEMFFRLLQDRGHGHLRHTIYLWLLSLQSCDGKAIQLSTNMSAGGGLPFISELSLLQKFVLIQLYRFHKLSSAELSQLLGESQTVIHNELQYLEYSGLTQARGVDRQFHWIPDHLVYLIGQELWKEGLIDDR